MDIEHRDLYGFSELNRVFSPKTIGIYGASPNPQSFGAKTYAHLKHYDGRVFLINSKYETISGIPCYKSPAETKEAIDCMVIAVPQAAVEKAVVECAESNVGGAVIYASGYAETRRADRIEAQKRLSSIARSSGLRIVGPNCMGFINFRHRAEVSFATGAVKTDGYRPGGIGLVSQSGAVGFALAQAAFRGVAFSHLIAGGNSCDVGIADCVGYLAQSEECKVIVCVFEGLPDPFALIRAGAVAWAHDKPLLVCKLGATDDGAEAAISHSGSLAGAIDAYAAACERARIIMVRGLDAVIEVASFFTKVRRCSAPAAAVVAVSGGAAVAATDEASLHGVPMPQPSIEVSAQLRQIIPEFGAARNPCDVTAAVGNNPEILTESCRALASDERYGAIVFPSTSVGGNTVERLSGLADAAAAFGKPVCVTWMSGWLGGPGAIETEGHPNLALFHSLDRCFFALAQWAKREGLREAGLQQVKSADTTECKVRPAVEKLLAEARGYALTERQSKKVLAAYGIPVVEERMAHSREEAVLAAKASGFPVVLKAESAELAHKSEAGVVRLNLASAQAVEAAYDEVMNNAIKHAPSGKVNGVLVQPMVSGGVEILIGAKHDPLFGPLVLVGYGGVLAEAVKDTALGLAPVTFEEALAMIGKLKSQTLLDGFRGIVPIDRNRLAEVVVRASRLVADCSDLISEFDINPLICSGTSITAVDALIVKRRKN